MRPLKSSANSIRVVAGFLCLAGALTFPAWGDDPPKEEPEAKAEQAEGAKQDATPKPSGNSLADAAARIKLQKPAGGEGSGLVISDQNLKKSGSGASVAQGTGAQLSGSAATGSTTQGKKVGTMSPEASALGNDIVQRYHAQVAVVRGLEVRLANWDKRLAEGSADPHYPKFSNSPQNRPPGVVDEAEGTRDLLAKQLGEERKKLDGIRKEAQRAGVTLSDPAAQHPAAPQAGGG